MEVYLDPRGAILLAHSRSWKDMAAGLRSEQDQPLMLHFDDFFETRLCGKGSNSYAIPMVSKLYVDDLLGLR